MEQIQINKIYQSSTITTLLASIILARLSCVALSNIPFFTITFIMLYAVALIFLLIRSFGFLTKNETGALGFLIVYVFEVVLSSLISERGIFDTQAFNSYIIVILFFLYLHIKRLSNQSQKLFFVIVLSGFTVTFIYSIVKLAQDPMLSRKAATGRYFEDSVDTLSAIGGFDTVYGGLLVFVILVYLWSFLRDKKAKMLVFLIMASCIAFIVMATYGTAIVLLIFAIALIIFRRNSISAFLVSIVLIVGVVCHESIGTWIMNLSDTIEYSDTFQEKINQIGYMIRYGESVGTLAGDEGRWARIGWSLDTFSQYPIFGGFTKPDVRIGSHSEVADLLGRFGLVGFISLGSFFWITFKDIASQITTKLGKKMLFVCISVYLAIAVLDPALYTQQILPIFILVPFVEKWAKPQGEVIS